MHIAMQNSGHWLWQRAVDFAQDESAAVTVDMVVLMAASISLTLAVSDKVKDGIENLSTDISDFLSDYEIKTSFEDRIPANEEEGS